MRKKILCIEDDLETAELIAEDLEERGYDMALAHDGQAGFSAVLKLQPDLVLCDVSMPVMNGFDVLDRLTELTPRFASMPFVFLTALGDRDNQLKGRRLGADDYVVKPIDFEILATIIGGRLAKIARTEVWSRQIALADREVECLTWAARGKTVIDTAQILGISPETVEGFIKQALRKLDASNKTHAVAKSIALGIIDL